MIIPIKVSFRFPQVLHRRFSFDTYQCYWTDERTNQVEVNLPDNYTVQDVIDVLNQLTKPENGCDTVRYKYDGQVGEVFVHLERTIDVNYHTTMFPDGRKVVWVTGEEDWYTGKGRENKLNSVLAAAGYDDLIM